MDRRHWARRIAQLDPRDDAAEIYRILVAHEFPWDMNQALSFALFRTYAVPSIGSLLHRTGEFTERTQKRYEDTGLLLDAVVEHGLDSPLGKTAVCRINQMHSAYGISNDDLRYVLCTFVAVPIRWMDAYGWRRFTEAEKTAPPTTTASWAGTWPSATSRTPGRSRSSGGCRHGGSRGSCATCRASGCTRAATTSRSSARSPGAVLLAGLIRPS